ncbi:hypothetical protein RND81_06G081900 [Saponaria officinalis]|uniref:Retrovirus-related Pol polyprotein from transposon TNT 1-94-like beta-barrel domain-containing protein n=1 Tax=Saponaria officinalis TaxID=3572 RepID=A0AAW1K4S5_SAPOF
MLHKIVPDLSKMELLDGKTYRRWSEKILFYFQQYEIDYVLFQEPQSTKESSTSETVKSDNKSAKDNRTVRGVMLHYMVDNLFDIYWKTKTAKGIWDALENKYGSDDFGTKKLLMNLVLEIFGEGMVLCKFMQANALIEKLPSQSWDEYKKHLRHKKKDMKLQELIGHIKIEDATRSQDRARTNTTNTVKANVVEYRNTGQGSSEGDDIIAAMVSEINLVGNLVEWIVDIGATRHICTNKDLYKELKDVDEKEVVYVGNSSKVPVLGIGKVHLKLTSGKVLALNNVLYVPDMRRNLISGALLNKAGLKLTFESDK